MVRVKYSLLVKIFATVMCCLFILPYIFSILFGSSPSKSQLNNNNDIENEKFKGFDDGVRVGREADINGGPGPGAEPINPDVHPANFAFKRLQKKKIAPQKHIQVTHHFGINMSNVPVFHDGVLGNYEPINVKPRVGPGEGGRPVHLDASEKAEADKTVREFGFNMVASGKISLDRLIKDTRNPECKFWQYPEVHSLPKASVVIVFVNEGWTTLIRTVHSVFNTSPPELIADVIMVDDFSNKDFLGKPMEDYVKRWNGKVKVVRTKERVGLVKARVIGAEHATGDVIVILDAHCECVTNWLPPLLTRIAVNPKALAIPIVEGIQWDTLETTRYADDIKSAGIWEWGFLYKEMTMSDAMMARKAHPTEPTLSPTHAGGLLAIDKKWFFELGGYDPGIEIWGGEQYELSFKVWQCGGVVEWVPCSHVAHIYRGPRTESVHPVGKSVHQSAINHMRVAEVWMDEYKQYFYNREPQNKRLDFGDISAQLAIREKLQCKSFKWFMENVAHEMLRKFPVPPNNLAWGEAVNVKNTVCLDVRGAGFGQPIGVSGCHHQLGNQLFRLNEQGELSSGEHCFISDKNIVKKKFCLNYMGVWQPRGEWSYDTEEKLMRSNIEKKCMTTNGQKLTLQPCDKDNLDQQWTFKEIYHSKF